MRVRLPQQVRLLQLPQQTLNVGTLFSDAPLCALAEVLSWDEGFSFFPLFAISHNFLDFEAVDRIDGFYDVGGGEAFVLMEKVGVISDHMLIGGTIAEILPGTETLVPQGSIISFPISYLISPRLIVLPGHPRPNLALTFHRIGLSFLLASQIYYLVGV